MWSFFSLLTVMMNVLTWSHSDRLYLYSSDAHHRTGSACDIGGGPRVLTTILVRFGEEGLSNKQIAGVRTLKELDQP
jgi:hypothetical protein